MTGEPTSTLRLAGVSLLAIGTFGAIAAAALLLSRDADAEWQRLRARGAAIGADLVRGERPHAPLRGVPVPGEATHHYLLATAEHNRIERELREQPQRSAATEVRDLIDERELPPDLEERLAPFRPAMALLAAGAASERLHLDPWWTPSEWAAANDDGAGEPFVGFGLSTVVLVAARHELARGRPEAALQHTADVLTLARDQLQVGLMLYEILGAGNASTCCSVWSHAVLAALPPPLLRELGEVLRRFEAETPPALISARSECRLTAEWAFHHPARGDVVQSLKAWFTSDDLHRCPDLDDVKAYFDGVDALPAASASWSVRQPALAALAEVAPGCMLAEAEHARREALAHVRLLRLAIAHHLGEPVPALPDPLGDGPLQTDEHEGGLRLASRGRSGDGKPIERLVQQR